MCKCKQIYIVLIKHAWEEKGINIPKIIVFY